MNTLSQAVQKVLSGLTGVKRAGDNQWRAKCPAHDDNDPSLSVKQCDNGDVLLHCHAGCSPERICDELGLKPSDLFAPKGLRCSEKVVHTVYPYRDEDGKLLFEVVRYRPKDFRQRRPDGRGGYVWKLDDVRRVIYRLPELIAADPSADIFIVEGEKDADRLAQAGLTATCNVGGAGKWKPEYNEHLRGRRVCIISDKDASGRKHAAQIAKSLQGVAAEVRLLELPGENVKDASDWFGAGGKPDELRQLVDRTPPWAGPAPEPQLADKSTCEDKSQSSTQSQALVHLADGAELFHDSDIAYATIEKGGHRENHAIGSKGFRAWLRHEYWNAHQKPSGSQAIQDALDVLSARALYEGSARQTAVRIAEHDGGIYLDLANEQWQAIKITTDEWVVVDDPPVKFIRCRGMQPLPVPVRGGSVEELRPLINAADDATWRLVVGWLIGAFRARGPYFILCINGEQGSAKSTLSRMLRGLIDPNAADPRSAPRDERDIWIAASNSRIVAYDNLSRIPGPLSDTLCRLATGGAYATRELFSDGDEKLFSAARPIIINGIEELATRPDLLERSVVLNLQPLADSQRMTEAELWQRYEQTRPGILGAFLDAIVAALRNLPSVMLAQLPRMADPAKWVTAAESALPWQTGGFMEAYAGNRDAANELALEASPVGLAIVQMMQNRAFWDGTATDLIFELEEKRYADLRTRSRVDWPKKPKAMSDAIRRITKPLREAGIKVVFDRTAKARRIIIERVAPVASDSSPASSNANDGGIAEKGHDAEVTQRDGPQVHPSSLPDPTDLQQFPRDDADDANDAQVRGSSNGEVPARKVVDL